MSNAMTSSLASIGISLDVNNSFQWINPDPQCNYNQQPVMLAVKKHGTGTKKSKVMKGSLEPRNKRASNQGKAGSKSIDQSQLNELLYQALETEMGGIQIYQSAIACAVDDNLRSEWQEYLQQTQSHRTILLEVFDKLGLDPATQTPGRKIVAHIGAALNEAITQAQEAGNPQAAQLVAAECVVLAETKDHLNWELIGHFASQGKDRIHSVLQEAHNEVEEEEDHHLYHTTGWCRELWIDSLGLPSVLPPPEEVKSVKTAIGAARAEQARDDMLEQ